MNGSLSIKELVAMSGMSRTTIAQHVRKLVETNVVEPLENIRSPKQRYRLIKASLVAMVYAKPEIEEGKREESDMKY